MPVALPPDQQDVELAYLRGHVAGLDRHSEHPTPPEATRLDPGQTAVVEGAATPQAPPMHTEKPRDERRPSMPTKAVRRPLLPYH